MDPDFAQAAQVYRGVSRVFLRRGAQYYLKPVAGKPFETVAVFVVPSSVAGSVQPTITWATKLPQYLAFPR